MGGFLLPLALAQVRLRGLVDSRWCRHLLQLASRSPAVLQRLSPNLRSIDLTPGDTVALEAVTPYLARLQSLSVMDKIPHELMSVLPTGLTRLSVDYVDLTGTSPWAFAESLLRLTALEELEMRSSALTSADMSSRLPRLRRIACTGVDTADGLCALAPCLESLELSDQAEDLTLVLPEALTALKLRTAYFKLSPLRSFGSLTGLRDLDLTAVELDMSELPALLATLTALTRLGINDEEVPITAAKVPILVDALEAAPEGMGLQLSWLETEGGLPALESLFRRMIQFEFIITSDPDAIPWAALSRLTRLVLDVGDSGIVSTSWAKALSQLPSLVDLELGLRGGVPPEIDRVAPFCTKLCVGGIPATANVEGLGMLTRLEVCLCSDVSVQLLANLPVTLRRLNCRPIACPTLPLRRALERLSGLTDLRISLVDCTAEPLDLTLLRQLAILELYGGHCPQIQLGPLPCIECLRLDLCTGLDNGFLRQLGGLSRLQRLYLGCSTGPEPLTDDILAPLFFLPLLEKLELPDELGHAQRLGSVRRTAAAT